MSSLRAVVLSRSLTKAMGPLVPGKAAWVGAAATPSRLAARIAAATTRHGLGRCILLAVSGCMVLLLTVQLDPGLWNEQSRWGLLVPAGPVGWGSRGDANQREQLGPIPGPWVAAAGAVTAPAPRARWQRPRRRPTAAAPRPRS